MAAYPTYGLDPGWLGQPKTPGQGQYTPVSYTTQQPIRAIGGGASYTNPGSINDPTLAPGYAGYSGSYGGSTSGVGGLPPGAISPPFQFSGGGIPNWMASQGWRVVRGPNGQNYWAPPHTGPATPTNQAF
jgi:hypothetical protein